MDSSSKEKFSIQLRVPKNQLCILEFIKSVYDAIPLAWKEPNCTSRKSQSVLPPQSF